LPDHLDVVRALRSLPDRHRQALVLVAVVGLSTREIAEELGTTEATVRSWLARGRKTMERRLS
jgi:RNA polymerase sigma-70 factor (ECF subfamily)